MKIVVVHNYYPERGGGEDSVFDEETELLKGRGHTVLPLYHAEL